MSLFGSRMSSSTYDAANSKASVAIPFPDPKNFTILSVEKVGDGVVAVVHYPGTTTFEGVKVLVFDKCDTFKLCSTRTLDPHFSDSKVNGRFIPVARFENTLKGRRLARICAAAL